MAKRTTTISQTIARTVQAYDIVLRSAQRAVAAPALQSLDAAARHQSIFGRGATDIGPIVVLDASGRMVDASGNVAPDQASGAGRDYFVAHEHGAANGLFVSRPYENPFTHDWTIALSRSTTGPDGRFNGVVAGFIGPADFAQLLSGVPVEPGLAVSLATDDGTVLYRRPSQGDEAGYKLPLDPQANPYEGVSPVTGEQALVAYSQVAGLPLVVSTSMPLSAVFAAWTAKTTLLAAMLFALWLAGGMLLRAMGRQQQRLFDAERRELEMSERSRQDVERHHAAKMEAVGRLTAGVAHDFNNYLQTITSSLEIMSADYLAEPEAKEIAQLAHKAANQGAKLTQRLLTFSRQQVLQPRRVKVAFLLSDLRRLIADSRIFQAPIRCKIEVEPFTDDLHVDATQVETCLLNLLMNARDAMPQGGTLHLQARNAGLEDRLFGGLTRGRHVILTVRDTGRGMDEATRAHAFEPFFTTKPFGNGSGLGLPMAQGFCHQSGGDIRILSNCEQPGTTVELWLPAMDPETRSKDEVEFNYATMGRRTGRVLLVEDEHDVLAALSAILISGGFEVVCVRNGAEGLMRLHDRQPYDAVLTDHSMPDMTGADFVARARTDMPRLPMLVLTGAEVGDIALAGLPPTVPLLRKPISRLGLLSAVREAIGETDRLLLT